MIRRPPRSTQSRSSAASDVYKRQEEDLVAEVRGAGRERRHLRAQLERLQALVGGHAHGAAGARLDDDVAAFADLLEGGREHLARLGLSLIHISEPTRLGMISYAVFCLKK